MVTNTAVAYDGFLEFSGLPRISTPVISARATDLNVSNAGLRYMVSTSTP